MIRRAHVVLILGLWPLLSAAVAAATPNVVLIYADDLGFGDVGCNGARAGLTPNVDRLARQGRNFTDAHATSATCTPSRYALLTGEYPWRRRGTGVLPGDARLIVEPGRATLAGVLRSAGYRTGMVGKWHLGLGSGAIDWNGEIKPGPLEVGFDECSIMAATEDRIPCVYVKITVSLGSTGPTRSRSAMTARSRASRRGGLIRGCSGCIPAMGTTWRSSTGSAGLAS